MTQNNQRHRPPTPEFANGEAQAQGWTLRDLFEQLQAAESLNQAWFDVYGHLLAGAEPSSMTEVEEALASCPADLPVVAGWLGCLARECMLRPVETAVLAPRHSRSLDRPGLRLS